MSTGPGPGGWREVLRVELPAPLSAVSALGVSGAAYPYARCVAQVEDGRTFLVVLAPERGGG